MSDASIYLRDDTIAALSTASGRGAVAIIRISGSDCVSVMERIFCYQGKPLIQRPRVLVFGRVVDPCSGETLDDALGVLFRGPNSYTGDDLAELHCHGSEVVVRQILSLLHCEGVRQAEPGEFTFRAVCNNKMDLNQAEAVAGLIDSRTQLARKLSLKMLEGGFSSDLSDIKSLIFTIITEVETQIEFPDDAEEHDLNNAIAEPLAECLEHVLALRRRAVREQRFNQGIMAVLAGRPNVGKSSLFNRLLGRERAIVTPHAGTTRDSIEGTIELEGRPVTLIDTAGLRETREEIEAIGVQRSQELLSTSHIVLYIIDASEGITDEDVQRLNELQRDDREGLLLLLANKSDLCQSTFDAPDQIKAPVVHTSTINEDGLDALHDALNQAVTSLIPLEEESSFLISARQEHLLDDSVTQCNQAMQRVNDGSPIELISENLRDVLQTIALLDGSGAPPDVMHEIFSRFCIGK